MFREGYRVFPPDSLEFEATSISWLFLNHLTPVTFTEFTSTAKTTDSPTTGSYNVFLTLTASNAKQKVEHLLQHRQYIL